MYLPLPPDVWTALEAMAGALLIQAAQAVGSAPLSRMLGSVEERKARSCLARAVGSTLAKYPDLDAVAMATDFRRPPLSDQVVRVICEPESELDVELVRDAFDTTLYDLPAIGLDGVKLLDDIRTAFLEELRQDPETRDLWKGITLKRIQGDMRALRQADDLGEQRWSAGASLLSADQFFLPWLSPRRVFSHEWELVGRREVKEQLVNFSGVGSLHRVAILPGRGGIGKTRLLLAVARSVEGGVHPAVVRFVAEGQRVRAEDVKALPEGALLVLDDGHRREDLDLVLAAALRARHPPKLLISTRPYGLEGIQGHLARIGYDLSDVLVIDELRELSREESIILARQALGSEHDHLAQALVRVTGDSPLVTVVGGRLLAEEALPPSLLSHHQRFRDSVLALMADEYAKAIGDLVDRILARQILELIAALGSLRVGSEALLGRAAEFLDIQPDQLKRVVGALEGAGVLVKRGDALRITPDVLSDFLYHRAAVANGRDTGFVDRVYSSFADLAGAQVLAGLAELDWRVRETNAAKFDLLEHVWTDVVAKFRAASYYRRVEILRELKTVSFYQPHRVLELVELAMSEDVAPDGDEPVFGLVGWTQERVLRAIPPLLQRVAYHPVCRDTALDLLWMIGRNDERALNPNPEHAVRVLADLASYKNHRLDIISAVLDAIERWLEDPEVHEHIHSVLDLVDPMLKKAGSRSEARGNQLVFDPFFVNPETTRAVRDRALAIVDRCLGSPSLKVVLRAVSSLEDALRPPMGHFGLTAGDDLHDRWLPEQRTVISRLSMLMNTQPDPLVAIAVSQAVSWHARFGQNLQLREAARELIRCLPWSFELGMAKHMSSRRFRCELKEGIDTNWDEGDLNLHEREASLSIERHNLVDEFIARYPEPSSGAQWLEERLTVIRNAGEQCDAAQFLATLSERHPKYGALVVRNVMDKSPSALTDGLGALIAGVRVADETVAFALCAEAADSQDSRLRAAAANVCRQAMCGSSPAGEWVALLRRLLSDEDMMVVRASLPALSVLGDEDPSLEQDLALEVKPGRDSKVVDQLLFTIAHSKRSGFRELDDRSVEQFLEKLRGVEDLDGHWIKEFLRHASRVAPRAVVDLVLFRARTARELDRLKFRAIPHDFENAVTGFNEVEDREGLVREVRDLALMDEGDHLPRWISRLFVAVSQGIDELGRSILQEWIDSESEDELRAVAALISEAHWRFCLDHHGFTAGLLRRAQEFGPELLDSCRGALLSSVNTRGGAGVVGQPMPQDLETRDRAQAIANGLRKGSVEREFYEHIAASAEGSISRLCELEDKMGV